MCSVYDYDPSPRNDQMVSIINSYVEASVPALLPEKAVLFKVFPFLLHIPDWLPGSHFKHEARMAREFGARMVEQPYEYVQKRIESKENINPLMVSDHIARMEKFEEPYRSKYEKALKQTSATSFLTSVETTSSALMTFTLAIVKHPRVWRRAQAEIDAVVGTDRLPDLDDRSSLSYVDAILHETLRWKPPVPLGAPHIATRSDIFNGFYIPKGATILEMFGDCRATKLDIQMQKNSPLRGSWTDDTANFVFGFGRASRYTANASLWIAMVTTLATLEFNLAKDADGKDVTFEATFLNGLARHPLTFPCHLTPRPHMSRELIETVLAI